MGDRYKDSLYLATDEDETSSPNLGRASDFFVTPSASDASGSGTSLDSTWLDLEQRVLAVLSDMTSEDLGDSSTFAPPMLG